MVNGALFFVLKDLFCHFPQVWIDGAIMHDRHFMSGGIGQDDVTGLVHHRHARGRALNSQVQNLAYRRDLISFNGARLARA